MRCIWKGDESAVMFCGIMNLPPPPTKFSKFNNTLLQTAKEIFEESMAEVVREAVEENNGERDITVPVDGSREKRGFSSKNGVVAVTSVDADKYYVKRIITAVVKDLKTFPSSSRQWTALGKGKRRKLYCLHPKNRFSFTYFHGDGFIGCSEQLIPEVGSKYFLFLFLGISSSDLLIL
ncbi:uncharacterized protein NPIL_457051 [Nephila pilipes]|uniref:Mutator-like transposase domain-containing protein n=1 Tax=Nephila pilipes TaxID=299642 RepID=A0A8X6P3B2_NEPPI|nr:uncharacterized protein NPIL_457051 [Nephila pilipes]